MVIMMLTRAIICSISLKSSTQDHIWSQKKVFLEQNISIRSFHGSFHNFHNVSIYVK